MFSADVNRYSYNIRTCRISSIRIRVRGAASRVMYQAARANEYADDVVASVLRQVDEVVGQS